MVEGNDTIEAYNAVAPFYSRYSEEKLPYLDAVDRIVIERLQSRKSLLDIGSGDGRRLSKFQSQTKISDITAIEPSAKMAEICRINTGVIVYESYAEQIDSLNLDKYDAITALWNVLGHIPNQEARIRSLKNIYQLMKPESILIIDVNNRHNSSAYGRWQVFKRTIIDRLNFKDSRGDAEYEWNIDNKSFKSRGHLFIPKEIEALFKIAKLTVCDRFSIDYTNGNVSTSIYKGQLLYILKPMGS